MIRGLLNKHDCLSISEFKKKFETKRTPVILSNSFDWNAMKKWDISYFKDKYKDKTVDLDCYSSLESQKWGSIKLKLPVALDLICNNADKSKKYYLMQKSIPEEFPEILSDIQQPIYTNSETKYFTNLWIGEAGIISQAHYDCSDNFLTQILGRKSVRLFAPSESENMYSYEMDNNFIGDKTSSHISRIQDTDLINYNEFPNLKNVQCFEGVLNPGDVLFIPAGWWHEIKSLETSISVNFWWLKKLYDLSDIQATNWICSTFFYFSNNKFDEIINTLFDFSEYSDDIEIAEFSLSKNLRCIAAVFLLNYFNKMSNDQKDCKNYPIANEISEWKETLEIAKKTDDTLLDDKIILNIIIKIKKLQPLKTELEF